MVEESDIPRETAGQRLEALTGGANVNKGYSADGVRGMNLAPDVSMPADAPAGPGPVSPAPTSEGSATSSPAASAE